MMAAPVSSDHTAKPSPQPSIAAQTASAEPVPIPQKPRETPQLWVRVTGQAKQSDKLTEVAHALGAALARADMGLITGGLPGVDAETRAGYIATAQAEHRATHLRIALLSAWTNELIPLADEEVYRTDDVIDPRFHGHVLVLFDGGGGARLVAEHASRAGVPVLPLASTGELPRRELGLIRKIWDEAPIAGLERADLDILERPFAAEPVIGLLEKIAAAHSQRPGDPAPSPTPVPQSRHPRAINDTATGPDLLDIGGQADIFAAVLASRALMPPLAIGIFGPWGAGKSFFIENIQRRVSDFARSSKAAPSQGSPLYWNHICQITFNAWHYMDADLWASLASRIFDGLAENLGIADPDDNGIADPESRRRELRRSLASAEEARIQAKADLAAAEKQLAAAQADVVRLQKEQADRQPKVAQLTDAEVWQKICDTDRANQGAMTKAVTKALKGLGIAPEQAAALANPERATDFLQDVAFWKQRALGVWNLRNPGRNWLVIVAFLALLLLPILIFFIARSWPDWRHTVEALLGLRTQIGAIAAVLVVRIWKQGRHLHTLMRNAQEIQQKSREIRQQIDSDNNQALQTAREEESEANRTIERLQQRIAVLQADTLRAQQVLDELDRGRMVYDFIANAKSQDGHYRSRQGVVALLRRDLETLSKLMRDWQSQTRARAGSETGDAGAPMPESMPQSVPDPMSESAWEQLPLQRIILYIDDLDRCPPQRVVEVLQAVHLLLAFRLFVVVVGVDPRWLERSLASEYRNLLGPTADFGAVQHTEVASAQDYLEKIFQVPYTLPPMDADGYSRLVDTFLPTTAPSAPPGPAQPQTTATAHELKQTPNQTPTQAPTEVKTDQTAAHDQTGTDDDPRQSPKDGATATSGDQGENHGHPKDIAADQAFIIDTDEQAFIKQLTPFIDTPRLAKRFFNIYRLLRVGVPPAHYNAFITEHEYRIPLLLLAISLGLPALGPVILSQLNRPIAPSRPPIGTSTSNNNNATVPNTTWPEFLDTIRRSPHGGHNRDSDKTDTPFQQHQQAWHQLTAILKTIDSMPPDIAPYRQWARIVGRYSFHW